MAEVRVRSEPTSPWPSVAILAIGLGAVVALLWGGVGRPPGPAADHRFALTALLVAAELLVTGAASWTLSAAPRRLHYRVRAGDLEVRTLVGRRRVALAAVREAEVIGYELMVPRGAHLGWPRSHLPGYYVGRFRLPGVGPARVAVGARAGQGVLLRTESGLPLLLSPRDPDALLALVRRRAPAEAVVRTRSGSSRRGRRRR